jgi:glycerol-1-phosphate dehydrogenase [NAD(P)+]
MLRPYADRLTVGPVVISEGALASAADTLGRALPAGRWLVVADPVTQHIAGDAVLVGLRGRGIEVDSLVLVPDAGGTLVANDGEVERLAERLRDAPAPYAAVVAVGSGTVNDIVKLATFMTHLPYAVVATAPSMNGYTSPISAILWKGVKSVQDAHIPRAVIADVTVLAAAPERMIASGFGDLLSKPVSNADWLLSHLLTGSKYCPDVLRLVNEGNRLLAGVAGRLPQRDPDAVARLTGALILSGYAMALAGTSAPASGGEHLVSHYLDMVHYAFGEPNDLHGCQVGVGTRVASALYERVLAWRPETLDVDARVAALAAWPDYERGLRARFGMLAEAVIPYARDGYPTPDVLRKRLQRVKSEWTTLTAQLGKGMRTPAQILAELQAAGCPTTFAAINARPERARQAVLWGRDIRSRYTILHFCWDIGMLESWADEILPELLG